MHGKWYTAHDLLFILGSNDDGLVFFQDLDHVFLFFFSLKDIWPHNHNNQWPDIRLPVWGSVPAHLGSPGKRAVKRVCVWGSVLVSWSSEMPYFQLGIGWMDTWMDHSLTEFPYLGYKNLYIYFSV